MRCCRFFLLAALLGASAPAHAQILIGPANGYVRYGPPVYRLGVGFVGSPYTPYGYSSTRITIVTVVPAPRATRSLPSADEPPGELPDIPVQRIRRAPKDLPPPVPAAEAPAPAEESARQIRLGKASFEAEEYGRAAQRFREANRLRPDEPLPYFLLAQSLIALGKYHDALDAILAGMARKPDWPAERFRPIDLYGGNVAEYPEHLLRLDLALTKHPGDPVLSFLNGYQVWFAGRREAAVPLFRQARDRLAGKPDAEAFRAACERFLIEK
jgi:hypothetical protein